MYKSKNSKVTSDFLLWTWLFSFYCCGPGSYSVNQSLIMHTIQFVLLNIYLILFLKIVNDTERYIEMQRESINGRSPHNCQFLLPTFVIARNMKARTRGGKIFIPMDSHIFELLQICGISRGLRGFLGEINTGQTCKHLMGNIMIWIFRYS